MNTGLSLVLLSSDCSQERTLGSTYSKPVTGWQLFENDALEEHGNKE